MGKMEVMDATDVMDVMEETERIVVAKKTNVTANVKNVVIKLFILIYQKVILELIIYIHKMN